MAFGYIPPVEASFLKIWVKRLVRWVSIKRRLQAPSVLRMLDLQNEDIVVDLGCGRGYCAYEMRDRVKNVLAFDIRSELLKDAAKASKSNTNFQICIADVGRLPLRDKSVSKALVSGTLQSVNEENILSECARIVISGGYVILVVLVEHVSIRYLYETIESKSESLKKTVLRLFSLPGTYEDFQHEYAEKHFVTKYYSRDMLIKLMANHGFEAIESRYIPGKLVSLLTDLFHLISWRSNRNSLLSNPCFSAFVYPAFWLLNRLDSKESGGNEIIMKFKKSLTS